MSNDLTHSSYVNARNKARALAKKEILQQKEKEEQERATQMAVLAAQMTAQAHAATAQANRVTSQANAAAEQVEKTRKQIEAVNDDLVNNAVDEVLEKRKACEEDLTARVLGLVDSFEVQSENFGGAIAIGSEVYTLQECGSMAGNHTNMCFYLSVTGGDRDAALRLKGDIAPAASAVSREIGTNVDFTEPSRMADTEVIRSYVLLKKTRVVVYNARANVAVSFRTDTCAGECIYLHTNDAHFQRLTPVI